MQCHYWGHDANIGQTGAIFLVIRLYAIELHVSHAGQGTAPMDLLNAGFRSTAAPSMDTIWVD